MGSPPGPLSASSFVAAALSTNDGAFDGTPKDEPASELDESITKDQLMSCSPVGAGPHSPNAAPDGNR